MSYSDAATRVRYVRHPNLPGVELLIAEPSTDFWRMFHDRYLLCACLSAATTWAYRHKTHRIEDGAIGFMEPGEVHRVLAKHKPSRFRAVFIEPDLFIKSAEEAGLSGVPHFRLSQMVNPWLLQEIVRLAVGLRAGSEALQLQSQFAIVVQQALTYTEQPPLECKSAKSALTRSLYRARDFLEDHVQEAITLDRLAAACGLSRFHLVRSFAREFGIPPHAYLVQRRVKSACALLRAGMPCAEAAPSVGFADQSHFTRHFKRIIGVTPSKYAHMKLGFGENGDAAPPVNRLRRS